MSLMERQRRARDPRRSNYAVFKRRRQVTSFFDRNLTATGCLSLSVPVCSKAPNPL